MKHFVRLYPKRWRRRYEAEVSALVARQRLTLAGVIDLIRGALDSRLHPSDRYVYVPTIGFRPSGTRTLTATNSVEHEDTRLTVVAVAASPLRTDVLVEWHRPADAVACLPGQYLAQSFARPPELGSAVLQVSGVEVVAEQIALGAYGSGMDGTHAFHRLRFPAIDATASQATLRVREAKHDFRVEVALTPAAIRARRLNASATLEGITIRASAAAWHEDELILDLEVSAPWTVGQVGTARPEQPRFGAISEEVRRTRAKELKRVMGTLAQPLLLVDGSGLQSPELRRIYPPHSRDSVPTVQRFAVVFEAPAPDARDLTLVVPFVELMHRDEAATVDLRALPADIAIGEHHFSVVSAEPHGSETRVIVQVPPKSGARYVVQPAGIVGSGGSYSWARGPDDRVWFAANVGDPPIVRFIGVVERVEGPWRVRVPLL